MNKLLFIIPVAIIIILIVAVVNSNNTAEKCIITVSGSSYDVSSLKNTHTGGDMFNCGADMTEEFNDEHGGNLNKIEEYLIP